MKRLITASALLLALSVQSHATTYSMWYSTTPTVSTWTPTFNSTLGTKFKVLNPGSVTGMAFYKAAGDGTTSRNLILWSTFGQNMAQCTTSSEPTGTAQWITCNLTTAFSVAANETYYVSYDLPSTAGTNGGVFSSADTGCDQAGSGNSNLSCLGAAQDRNLSTYPATPGQLPEPNTIFADVLFTPCP